MALLTSQTLCNFLVAGNKKWMESAVADVDQDDVIGFGDLLLVLSSKLLTICSFLKD